MIRRLTIDDLDMITDIMSRPEIFEQIRDNVVKTPEDLNLEYLLDNDSVYFMSYDDKGFGLFMPHTIDIYYAHVFVLPELRGEGLVEKTKMVLKYMYDNTSCKAMLGYTPVTNRAAVLFAYKVGFKKCGEFMGPDGLEVITSHRPEDL